MAKAKSMLSRIRLVYRHSPLLLKCAVLVTIVLSTVALTTLRIGISQYQDQTALARAEAAQLEQENRQLEENIQQLGTVDSVRRIAQEELGLVDPNTRFYNITD